MAIIGVQGEDKVVRCEGEFMNDRMPEGFSDACSLAAKRRPQKVSRRWTEHKLVTQKEVRKN